MERLREKASQRVSCECGGSFARSSKKRHVKIEQTSNMADSSGCRSRPSTSWFKQAFTYIMVKRMLELFSGTHSESKVAEPLGYEVVSVDRDMEATHKCDIMHWDYLQYPAKHFDVIWASPPCTEYSRALTNTTEKHSTC